MVSMQVVLEGTKKVIGAGKGKDGIIVVSDEHFSVRNLIDKSDVIIFTHWSENKDRRFCHIYVPHVSHRAMAYEEILRTAPSLQHEPDGTFFYPGATGEETRELVSRLLRRQ